MVLFNNKKKMVTKEIKRLPMSKHNGLEEEEEELKEAVIGGMEEEDLEEEDIEALEEEEKNRTAKATPKKSFQYKQSPYKQNSRQPKTPPVERYTVFTQPPRVGIADSETREILGEGELAVLQVLANILTRLERIEANLGSMMGEETE